LASVAAEAAVPAPAPTAAPMAAPEPPSAMAPINAPMAVSFYKRLLVLDLYIHFTYTYSLELRTPGSFCE